MSLASLQPASKHGIGYRWLSAHTVPLTETSFLKSHRPCTAHSVVPSSPSPSLPSLPAKLHCNSRCPAPRGKSWSVACPFSLAVFPNLQLGGHVTPLLENVILGGKFCFLDDFFCLGVGMRRGAATTFYEIVQR